MSKNRIPDELLAEYSEQAAQATKERNAKYRAAQPQDTRQPVENLPAAIKALKKKLGAR